MLSSQEGVQSESCYCSFKASYKLQRSDWTPSLHGIILRVGKIILARRNLFLLKTVKSKQCKNALLTFFIFAYVSSSTALSRIKNGQRVAVNIRE